MKWLDLPTVKTAQGTVQLPGSKSISNRILLLAALAEGTTQIHDLLASDDTARMLDALTKLGISVIQTDKNDYCIIGGKGVFPVVEADLFLGNAGTAFRPLCANFSTGGKKYFQNGVGKNNGSHVASICN